MKPENLLFYAAAFGGVIIIFFLVAVALGVTGSTFGNRGVSVTKNQNSSGSTSGALTTSSSGFDKNNVISDNDFTNTSTMTVDQIQQFLTDKKSVLAAQKDDGQSAAEIIYNAAQKYSINPQVILVVLQKEQSLISSNTNDLSRRLRKAMGAACFDNGTCDVRTFGFARQVDSGTQILRHQFDQANSGKTWNIGQTIQLDGISVTFANKATISLYKYTPHVNPDKPNFYRFFRDFFLSKG